GLASGLVNTTGQVGGAIGLALLATLSSERTARLLADGEGQLEALNGGYHLAYLIGAAAAVVAIVAAVTVLRSESPAGAMAAAAGHGGQPGAPDEGAPGEPAYDPA
ncbi:MAG: hypothetical protein QOI32_260, partial [Thermoleophilaceae bacterium]|nr:hypothetical protein [Thermoleophilaceae bacterium]